MSAENNVGTRQLRVALNYNGNSFTINSIWMATQPAVQLPATAFKILAGVDVTGLPRLIQLFEDPRILRGAYREGMGHSYLKEESGQLVISVPFIQPENLRTVIIRIADLTNQKIEKFDYHHLSKFIENNLSHKHILHEITSTDLQVHSDWPKIAVNLGLHFEAGKFEIYKDKANLFRWRMRRPNGEIVAESGQGFRTMEQCQKDLQWIKANAGSLPVESK